VFYVSIPLLSGPGCLTVTTLLFSQTSPLPGSLALVAALLAIYARTFAALSSAKRVKQVIGRTGDDILRLLHGVILAALSTQFITEGLRHVMVS
jgi:multiple antibiotic resistance protein